MLSRDDILKSNGATLTKVHVEEWGGDVWLQPMDGLRRDQFEQMSIKYQDGDRGALAGWRSKLLVYAIVDQDGSRIFSDRDVDKLALKDGAVLQRLAEKAVEISGLKEDAVEIASGN